MKYIRTVLPLTLTLLLAACGGDGPTPTPPTETPPVEQPPVVAPPPVQPPPEDPNAVPYAGEWLVTYTSSLNSSDTFIYALNITLKAPADGNLRDGGIGLAIECQSSTTCEYATGAPTNGYGFIGNLELDDGTAPLALAIFDDAIGLFYFTADTNNAVGADAQGRPLLEGLGAWESSPDVYTDGLVTATRIGDARTLQQAPTPPEGPTPIPPEDPDPPTDPIQPPPEDPEPTPEPPEINSFTASSTTIESGDDVTLSWDVDNAETLRISPDVGTVSGSSVLVSPDETTTYTLTATNDDGSDQASVRVRVQEPEPEPEPEPEEPRLEYWVNSDCGEVSTTYATAGGGTAQRDFGNGVVYRSDDFSSGDFVYISAQNQCDSGDVTVRIYKRGNIYRETSSSGAYVIATASGTY